jgi:chromosome segregation ATPase
MTQEITSKNERPTSADVDIARLKERYERVKEETQETRVLIGDLREILLAHMENASERHAQLLATFNQHRLENAVLSQKVLQIDTRLAATDTRIEESTKRDPVTFWTSIAAAGTAVGAIATAIFGGKP